MTRAPKPAAWQAARVVSIREETRRVKTIQFVVSTWPGHLPGQHADVRLTAEDGYRAERSYSIASPPEEPALELTVDRLDDGEVSPFLTGQLQTGDTIQLRGPIGGYFVWSAFERPGPLLLVAGGSGVVPLMCMLRHRKLSGSAVPTALLYSSRTREDVIYHGELTALARSDPQFTLLMTLTRDSAPGWSGRVGRIDLPAVQALLERLGGIVDSFVCGPTDSWRRRLRCCYRPASHPTRYEPSVLGQRERSAAACVVVTDPGPGKKQPWSYQPIVLDQRSYR